MEIRKISRRRPGSVDDAELGISRCCFAENGKEMYKDNTRAQLFFVHQVVS